MTSIIEKRRKAIINTIYFALIALVVYCIYKWLLPLFLPFIFAFMFAALINRPISAIEKRTPIKRSYLSVAFVLLAVVVIAGAFFLIGIELFERTAGFYDYLVHQLQNITSLVNDFKLWILDFTAFLPEGIRSVLHENVTLFFDNIIQNGFKDISIDMSMIDWSALLSKGGEMLSDTVGKIPSTVIGFVIFLISTVFISADYAKIKRFFVKQLSDEHAQKLSSGWHLAMDSLKKMLRAYCLIIVITTFELTVGLYLLKIFGVFDNPYIIFIALGIAIVDIIPVLGTGTILIPWAVISFITGNIGLGIGLLIIYIVVLIIRQIIEPKLVAGQVGLPPIATIVAMYVGSKTLGILGFFILPFFVILIKVFNDAGIIHLIKDVHRGEKNDEQTEVPAEEK